MVKVSSEKKRQQQKLRPDVPNAHHIARHCNPQRLIFHPDTGALEGVYPQEFELRVHKGEDYLSVHQMETFAADLLGQFKGVIVALRTKRTVAGKSAIARLNVGDVVSCGASRGHPIRVRDKSKPGDIGYAGVSNMPLKNEDQQLLAAMASCCADVRLVAAIEAA